MNITAMSIVAAFLAFVAGSWVLLRRIRKGGENKVKAEIAVETSETQARMAEAQANAPVGKKSTVQRLREKGL